MEQKIHIWPKPFVQKDGLITIAAAVEIPGMDRWQLWYRVPETYSTWITKSADPFLLGILFTAMKRSLDVHVNGMISTSLLRNLAEFQKAWALWLPKRYHPVEFSASSEQEQPRVERNETIMAFSGGVDSAFTAWQNRPNQAGLRQRNLTTGVMVHGFDIPIDQPEVFARAAEKSRLMLSSIGKDLIPISTNLREQYGNWENSHGAALAACLMLFQGRFNTGLIASSYPYNGLILPYGSNPITDRMLSNDSFQIVHDGAAYPKIEKIRQISQWPEAVRYLRVCWEGRHKDRNCCRCQKCVWTMLVFRAVGYESLPAFPYDITDREIRHLKYSYASSYGSIPRLIKLLRSLKFTASTLRALEVSVLMNRARFVCKQNPLLKRLFQAFEDRWFLNPDLAGQPVGRK
jgi:hypothetical protein